MCIRAIWSKFYLLVDIYYSNHWFGKRTIKALFSLREWTYWFGPALSANCTKALFVRCASYNRREQSFQISLYLISYMKRNWRHINHIEMLVVTLWRRFLWMNIIFSLTVNLSNTYHCGYMTSYLYIPHGCVNTTFTSGIINYCFEMNWTKYTSTTYTATQGHTSRKHAYIVLTPLNPTFI